MNIIILKMFDLGPSVQT